MIAIIGILATVSVIALSNARAKSRDAKRIADVKQVQTALELYFNDMNRYPLTAEFSSAISSTSTIGTTTYMARIPLAATPADGNCSDSDNSFYYSSTDGSSYSLSFCIGGNTGSLTAGLNTLSPGGIAYSGAGSGDTGGSSCSCTDAGAPCCDACDPARATCQGGTYCANNGNCPVGLSCSGGTCTDFVCGDSITISAIAGHVCNAGTPDFDKCTYDTIEIGTQCWMKQNMNIGDIALVSTPQSNNVLLEKYCQSDIANYCLSYGGMYQWNEAMQYSVAPGSQGICPTGWHIPTDTEQDTLDQYMKDSSCDPGRIGNINGCTNAGNKLQSPSGWNGLSGRAEAYFWSSTINGATAWTRYLYNGATDVHRYSPAQTNGFFVRCLQN